MTPDTASSHLPPPRNPASGVASLLPRRLHDTPDAANQAKIAPSTAAAAPNSPPRSAIRCRLPRPAHPLRKPPPR